MHSLQCQQSNASLSKGRIWRSLQSTGGLVAHECIHPAALLLRIRDVHLESRCCPHAHHRRGVFRPRCWRRRRPSWRRPGCKAAFGQLGSRSNSMAGVGFICVSFVWKPERKCHVGVGHGCDVALSGCLPQNLADKSGDRWAISASFKDKLCDSLASGKTGTWVSECCPVSQYGNSEPLAGNRGCGGTPG